MEKVRSIRDGGLNQPSSSQYRLTTIFAWMTVIALPLAVARGLQSPFVYLSILPLTCIPMLFTEFVYNDRELRFSARQTTRLIFALAIFSFFMLMLSTVGFTPHWKGSKGEHWFYYVLDYPAGLTLWPIYLIGNGFFILSLSDAQFARHSATNFVALVTLAAISSWYTMACLLLRFTFHEIEIAIIPGSVAVCFGFYCAIVWKNRQFRITNFTRAYGVWVWLTGTLISIVAKVPIARRFYVDLPDTAPEGCFVVTAASQGHPWIVQSYLDAQGNVTNQQLVTFRQFEVHLRSRFPLFHFILRTFYNRIGPLACRIVVFKWQADMIYLALKPMEWMFFSYTRIL